MRQPVRQARESGAETARHVVLSPKHSVNDATGRRGLRAGGGLSWKARVRVWSWLHGAQTVARIRICRERRRCSCTHGPFSDVEW